VRLGDDAYAHLDELPFLDPVSRPISATTADPAGSNTEWTHSVGAVGGGRLLAQLAGPGLLTFIRMQEATGAPWTASVDGGPPTTIAPSDLGQRSPSGGIAASMPYPTSLGPDLDQGSSIIATPIAYARSLSWASAGRNGNFYALGRRVPTDVNVAAWSADSRAPVAAKALAVAGTDLAPTGAAHVTGSALAGARETTIIDRRDGPREMRDIHFVAPAAMAAALGSSRLRIYWDGDRTPAVDAPLKFVAGDGAGVYRPEGRPFVGGLLSGITWRDGRRGAEVDFRLSWPMPYQRSARVTLTPAPREVGPVTWSLASTSFAAAPCEWAPFHATYTDIAHPTPGEDMRLLDATGAGRVVGTIINFGRVGPTLEGDLRMYVDGSRTPQVVTTGTEEWGLGGNYWRNGHQTTLPLGGLPSTTENPTGEVDGAALYRTLVDDSVPFLHDVSVRLEHGGRDESVEPYRTCVLWYGRPEPAASVADSVTPADPASASTHRVDAPSASTVSASGGFEYTVTAVAESASGLESSRPMSATLALGGGATHAFVRWTLDAAVPNQRARVLVDGADVGELLSAGTSAAADGGGIVRRWREVELPLPADRVKDRREVRVTLVPEPLDAGGAAQVTLYRLQLWKVPA